MTAASAYLDYNATAPLRPEAGEAMARAFGVVGNPSSVHRHGRLARRTVEEARDAVARLAQARPADVVFTSGGTEANALAIEGAAKAGIVARVLVSAIEHPCVLAAADATGLPVTHLPVDASGRLELAALKQALASDQAPALVSVMTANNETGVIQPVGEIAEITHEHGGIFHTDAVQAAGKMPLDATGSADLVSLSAHKLGGPQGIGALIVRCGLALAPQLRGGGQERGLRAGTQNSAGIAGFGAAAQAVLPPMEKELARLARLRTELEARAKAVAGPALHIVGETSPRLPNTACLAIDGMKAETLVIALDLGGASVSAGSACSSGKVTRSHVLDAMGLPESLAEGAIRVSLGWASTQDDIERFLSALEGALARTSPRTTENAGVSRQVSE